MHRSNEKTIMSHMSLLSIVIIVLVSLINNWFVQLGYYVYAKNKNPHSFDGHKTLLDYWTGVVGDGVIVPFINVFIYFVIVSTGASITLSMIFYSYILALGLDIFVHYFQASQSMTNWSMPRPFHWNGAGKWHMFSFPLQIAYLLIYLYTLITYYDVILHAISLLVSFAMTLLLSLFFLFLFWVDYKKN